MQEVAFEGNFVQVHVQDAKGAMHMVQVRNDPSLAPPKPAARLNFSFPAERAVVLADAAARSMN